MSRLFYHVMQDNEGNLLFGVSGTMRVAGSGTLATIYGDEELTVVLPNPMTNHPSFGSFKCFLGAGDYDFHMAKAGYTFETLTGVQGHGTLAQQDADAVAITGGNATLGTLTTANATITGGSVTGLTQCHVNGNVGVRIVAQATTQVYILQNRGLSHNAITIAAQGNDGNGLAVNFLNVAGNPVGTIYCSAVGTAYNTASDERLKEAVTTLGGALETVLALRPVAFRWKADGTPGQGFLAQDALQVVPEAVTGNPHDPQPTMQMDLSKLVPHLVGAVKELAQQVQALTARLEAAGA